MGRTIGHTGRRFGPTKKLLRWECRYKMRAKTRMLLSGIRAGTLDYEDITWPHKHICSNWWNWNWD